jgi:hypothetical protein
MLAPLATIAFLSVLWLAFVAVARMFEHSGPAILAALHGRSPLATAHGAEVPARVSHRGGARLQPTLRATPRLRAAA